MTGSTLYRRLPDGTWAAQREDPTAGRAGEFDPVEQPSPPVQPSPSLRQPSPPLVQATPAAAAAPAAMTPASASPASASPASASPPSASPASASAPAASPAQGSAVPPGRPPRGRGEPSSGSGRPPGGGRRAKRRTGPLRIIAIGALAYLLWIMGLMVYAAVSLQTTNAASAHPIADTPGSVWLLVGSDSRAGLTKKQQKQLKTGDEQGQRTDTIMLAHMSGLGAATLVSIPRDSWVTIPAHVASNGSQVGARSGKINAAFSYGGAPLLAETIEYNTGLHVDHYMEVGMRGIVSMTNAVGGIEVCFDAPISDEKSGLDVDAGCQVLNGRDALAWVRMRYSDPKGDIGRIERQQQYVALMTDQLLSWQTVLNPKRQLDIVNGLLNAITVDEDAGTLSLARLGLGLAGAAAGSGEVATVPTLDDDHWENGQWVLKWDPQEAGELFDSLGGSTPQSATDDRG